MLNQTSFRLTTTLLPTDTTAKTTEVINKVDANGDKFKPTFTEETVVLTNDDRTVMETTRATCTNGVLTFVKRGLSDDNSATEVASRKLTRNPGTLAFITAGASDYIDIDDNLTWTGNQTYTSNMEVQGSATYCGNATYKGMLTTEKGVKYPNFADVTALQAYASPYAGMFATVDDTGELYRYNAFTCCWDMVSSVALGTYQIQVENTTPAACTADTIVTLVPNEHEIYVGNRGVVLDKYLDLLVVAGGGGGGSVSNSTCAVAGGGGGGGVEYKQAYYVSSDALCVVVGAGGAAGAAGCNGSSGGASRIGNISVLGGGGGGKPGAVGLDGGSGGGGGGTCAGGMGFFNMGGYKGGKGTACTSYSYSYNGGKGGGASGAGGAGTGVTAGMYYNIGGETVYVSEGGGGGYRYDDYSGCSDSASGGSSSTAIGGGGGGGGYMKARQDCCWKGRQLGQAGQNGVVKVAYPTDGSYGIHCATGGTVTTCGDYTIHTFTSNGTFCIKC